MSNRPLAVPLAALVLAALAGCATPASPGADSPEPLSAEVRGQGYVLQKDDGAPQLCFAALESYPPQCSGPELVGWDWNAVDGEESANGVTWGTYAVQGVWDGTRLTVTDSVMLALYDPVPVVDPFLDEANAGASDEASLLAIQETIADEAPVSVLSSVPQNGYLFVTVLYDDGAVQKWADTAYGEGVVQVRGALAPMEP